VIDPALVEEAAERLRGVARRTPLTRSLALERVTGVETWLKLENEQLTGSFKLRGAFNALASLNDAQRARGVVASSAGNHGLGLAWAARHFGVRATIFVPADAPAVKREGIGRLGAAVDASRPDYDAAHEAALDFARAHGAVFVNPCAGDALLAGQGTVALEILEELPALATLVVAVGGAGLLGGVASVVRARAPAATVVGAQGDRTAAMARSLEAGRVVEVPVVPTLADGLAGQIDDTGLAIGRRAIDRMAVVPEAAIERAIAWLATHEGIVAEGSGAVTVAALLEGAAGDLRGPVAAIVSGGNIDAARHRAIVAGEASRGRKD
jgi:threonine dehydratase